MRLSEIVSVTEQMRLARTYLRTQKDPCFRCNTCRRTPFQHSGPMCEWKMFWYEMNSGHFCAGESNALGPRVLLFLYCLACDSLLCFGPGSPSVSRSRPRAAAL